jgi:predicted ATPase
VGREREMVEVKRLLSMTRLLTLTGAGGSGKTRLALEVAKDLVGTYPDGAWMVELASLSEPDLVAQEVAGALKIAERAGQPLTDTLVDALGDKELLLVMDNCEHLVETAAQLVDLLLDSCPRLKVLATSREPLGVSGEVNRPVPLLSLPDAVGGSSTVEYLMRYEAVRLFVDRARLRLPDFQLAQENTGATVRVCRKLEGIPLAIELATARMGVLAVEQVAQRLEVSLDVLKGTSRMAAPRQQTLRATLDWSHNLLIEVERALFRRLSVFAGGGLWRHRRLCAREVSSSRKMSWISLVGWWSVAATPTTCG